MSPGWASLPAALVLGGTLALAAPDFEALQMQVPAARYRISARPFPERLPAIEYPADAIVRRVQQNGVIYLHRKTYFVGEAFYRLDVALRPTTTDGFYKLYFANQQIGTLDLKVSLAQ